MCCKFILLYFALLFIFSIYKLVANYAKHCFNYKRAFTLPFQSEMCFFKKDFEFFQTLAYMLIWSSKVVTWVWFLAWAILLAKNNARSWKVAHFSQVELITCFHEFWNYESTLFHEILFILFFLRGIWDQSGQKKMQI